MTKLVMGKQGNQPFVKVMRNDEDDPYIIPDSDFGAFLFNSNNQELGYIEGIEAEYAQNPKFPYPGSSSDPARRWWPAGSGWNNADFYTYSYTLSGQYLRWYAFINNLYGDFGDTDVSPFVELNRGNNSSGVMRALENFFQYTGIPQGPREGGHWAICVSAAWRSTTPGISMNPVGTDIEDQSSTRPGNIAGIWSLRGDNDKWLLTTWDIPGNNMPLSRPSATPVAGQEQIRLDSTGIKIARRGFTVDDTDPRRFIMTSDKIPVKIMATGTATLPNNTDVDIPTPLDVTDNTVVRIMARRPGTNWTHPPLYTLNTGQGGVITYQPMGDFVRFRNSSGSAIEIRYMIFCDDTENPTSGGEEVFRRVDDYIQIKKPGSSDTEPSISDVVLDTRLVYPTIVDEGFIGYQDMTESPSDPMYGTIAKTVNFTNDGGFVPYVMYNTVYDAGGGKTSYKTAFIRILFTSTSSPWQFAPSRQSSLAEITDTSVKFHLTRDNPWTVTASSSGYSTSNNGEPNPIGIRYYIFAIPNTL